jgi:hypothetical protein
MYFRCVLATNERPLRSEPTKSDEVLDVLIEHARITSEYPLCLPSILLINMLY